MGWASGCQAALPGCFTQLTCGVAGHQQQEGVCNQLITGDVAGLELQGGSKAVRVKAWSFFYLKPGWSLPSPMPVEMPSGRASQMQMGWRSKSTVF